MASHNKQLSNRSPKSVVQQTATKPAWPKALAALLALGVFVAGVGGGVLYRLRNRSKVEATQESTTKPEKAGTAKVSASDRSASAMARKAAEQVFGQHFRRGHQNFHAERYSQAVQDFERAVQVAPHLAEGHFYLGESYYKMFLSTKAEAEYRESLKLMSDFRPAQEQLAVLLHKRGAYREALELLDTMEQQQPGDPIVAGEMALNHLALGDATTAIPLLQRFNRQKGKQAWGHAQLGRAHEMTGDAAQAEELFREALAYDARFAQAHLWLGQLLAKNGREADANQSLAEYDRLRKLETREHELAMAQLQSSPSPELLARLADTRFQLGKYESAWQALERAERLAPRDPLLFELRSKWTGKAPRK